MHSLKIILLVAVVAVVALAEAYPKFVYLEDHQIDAPQQQAVRISRDDKWAAAPSSAAGYKGNRGRVGPVYTFVKTDPKSNFKWGVRHRVGAQYGR